MSFQEGQENCQSSEAESQYTDRRSFAMSDDSFHVRFVPGQEPEVLTSVSDECSEGGCENCRGIFIGTTASQSSASEMSFEI